MLPKRIEFLLIFFDIFGYDSGSSKLSRQRNIACFIYIIHILFGIFLLFYKIRLIFEMISLPIIELINVLLQYSAALYFYWFIIVDSIFYKREHHNFWKILKTVTQVYRCNTKIENFSLKFMVYLFMTIWRLFVFVLSIGDAYEYIYVYNILFELCEMRVVYYIFCVEVLHSQMEAIDDELKHKDWIKSNGFRRNREYYSHVREMTNSLNKAFGLSQVAGILCCFYMVLTEFNWILTHFDDLLFVVTPSKYYQYHSFFFQIKTIKSYNNLWEIDKRFQRYNSLDFRSATIDTLPI